MHMNRPALCICLLMILLFAAARSKRRCRYSAVLIAYRSLIVADLERLNLIGSSDSSGLSDHCPSAKAHQILHSIYSMTQLFKCVGGQQGNVEKVVDQMEQVIIQNCNKAHMEKKQKSGRCKSGQRLKGTGRSNRKKMELVQMLINCWQKLLSVYAPSTGAKHKLSTD